MSAQATAYAYISDDEKYRYSLTRIVAPLTGEGTCTFVMLNPSTADGEQDDPTIRRCIGFARAWGFERLKVVNLYAYRATDPRDLWAVDPYPPYVTQIGPENDCTISKVIGGSDLVVCAWGAGSRSPSREGQVLDLIGAPHCLGLTKYGAPRHPLYVKADALPQPFAHCHPVAAWSGALPSGEKKPQ